MVTIMEDTPVIMVATMADIMVVFISAVDFIQVIPCHIMKVL
jgi:hypothetical protein